MRRYLASDGDFGEAPEWYTVMRAAKYLGVAPWELLEQNVGWTNAALVAMDAEAKAARDRERRNSRKVR